MEAMPPQATLQEGATSLGKSLSRQAFPIPTAAIHTANTANPYIISSCPCVLKDCNHQVCSKKPLRHWYSNQIFLVDIWSLKVESVYPELWLWVQYLCYFLGFYFATSVLLDLFTLVGLPFWLKLICVQSYTPRSSANSSHGQQLY